MKIWKESKVTIVKLEKELCITPLIFLRNNALAGFHECRISFLLASFLLYASYMDQRLQQIINKLQYIMKRKGILYIFKYSIICPFFCFLV